METEKCLFNVCEKTSPVKSVNHLKSNEDLIADDESGEANPIKGERKKSACAKKKKKSILKANITLSKYTLVRQVLTDHGFTFTDGVSSDCFLIWSDAAVPAEKIASLKSYQKINHFTGMGEICRKDSLARNIWRVQRHCSDDFNFVPQTWVLPGEYAILQFHVKELKKKKKSKTFIRKPVNGAMGHGIWLTRNAEKISPNDTCIIQEYLDKPLLMDGFKFDLRIYVFVMSCDPLKIFLYDDGLVRMSTEPYVYPSETNISHSFMHLTNYSINKHSDNFVQTTQTNLGSKRTLKYFWDWLREKGENVEEVWNRIADVVIKTILVAEPHLFHAYHMCRGSDPAGGSCCFEILGFDVFLDRKYKPWILEVNRAPSFGADQDLDHEIKYGVLRSALELLNVKTTDRVRCQKTEKVESRNRLMRTAYRKGSDTSHLAGDRKKILQKRKKDLRWRLSQIREENDKKDYEDKHMGGYVRIYPPVSKQLCEHYDKLLSQCTKVITGRTTLQKNSSQLYQLKEEEVLDLLQEVENNVLHLVDSEGKLVLKGPPPLSSMPPSRKASVKAPTSSMISVNTSPRPRSHTPSTNQMRVNKSPKTYSAGTRHPYVIDYKYTGRVIDETKVTETLKHLQNMKIKFPGKSDQEARLLLDQIQENWKFHRPRVAAYWLVKLDAMKRRKVIDIVKGNVLVILQKMWETQDLQKNTLYRMFNKIFNRLLWSHGQGLWNCFNTNGDSWESMFTRSSEKFSQIEMNCCRQVVKLCRECLLVVYQFASESHINGCVSDVDVPKDRIITNRSFTMHQQRISSQFCYGSFIGSKLSRINK